MKEEYEGTSDTKEYSCDWEYLLLDEIFRLHSREDLPRMESLTVTIGLYTGAVLEPRLQTCQL